MTPRILLFSAFGLATFLAACSPDQTPAPTPVPAAATEAPAVPPTDPVPTPTTVAAAPPTPQPTVAPSPPPPTAVAVPAPATAAPTTPATEPSNARTGPAVVATVLPMPVGYTTEVHTEVEFDPPLASADVLLEIAERLRTYPGIYELRGDAHGVEVIYDPGFIPAARVPVAFEEIGYPVKVHGTEVMDPGESAD